MTIRKIGLNRPGAAKNQSEITTMKRLSSIWMLMMVLGLSGESVALLDQAAAASADIAAPAVRHYYRDSTRQQINAINEHTVGREKRALRADRTNEVEAKRLKLILLLVMSLGPYPTALRS
jgi:hypothetical protein